ncbi:hypothetical protein HCY52_08065 [Acinetobacter radioresistens]|uniref:hypothetical protein n=1 Tax=Acinetobacter radioresistens TaxID=40216 RepID=UPI002003946D|nr:hypothetical protein [Acinetobacter radioresistens]MCK4083770.1 hypothetical protein [Acinetobacter radioresistens]
MSGKNWRTGSIAVLILLNCFSILITHTSMLEDDDKPLIMMILNGGIVGVGMIVCILIGMEVYKTLKGNKKSP